MVKGTIFSKITANYQYELIDKIKEWCRINSQYDDATKDANNPFGKGVSDALKYFEDLAREKGLDVNAKDTSQQEAPLHWAVNVEDKEMMKILGNG